jgi:outer membrane protein assembly factor BamB
MKWTRSSGALAVAAVAAVATALAGTWVVARAADAGRKSVEWPQWRGADRDGLAGDTGLLKDWPEGGPRQEWKLAGMGGGFSSVAVAGGKIFTLGDRDGKCHLVAIDARKHTILWSTPFSDGWGDGGPRSTPTVDGRLVYALSPHGELVCCDVAKGAIRWQKSMPRDFDGHMMSGWGYSESLLVDGERLICTPGAADAGLVALNKQNGETLWKCQLPEDLGGAGYASIVISEAAGVRQYVQLMGRGLIGVAADDGRFLWHYGRIANGTANIPTSIVRDDLVFCSTGYNTGAALLRLAADGDGVRADEVYFLEPGDMQNHHGGMVLVGDYVYCGHGHNNGFPLCVELETGDIAWSQGRGPGSG